MKAMLEDIAVRTGGKAVTGELGLRLERMTLEDLGQTKKITIDRGRHDDRRVAGAAASIAGRVTQLLAQSRTRRPIATARSCRNVQAGTAPTRWRHCEEPVFVSG